MPLKHLKHTPRIARIYLFWAVLLIALPSILSFYDGHTGKFLVATGAVEGTEFEKTVIYLTHHSFGSARGVIVNKPLRPGHASPNSPVEKEEVVNLMRGGPLKSQDESWLVLRGKPLDLKEYNALWPPEEIISLKVGESLFAGYAGWGVLQLNREITRGAWGVIEYDPELMFDTPPEDIWEKAMGRVLQSVPPDPGGV